MADTKTIPPYQVADNPHALIHCGPVFKESLITILTILQKRIPVYISKVDTYYNIY